MDWNGDLLISGVLGQQDVNFDAVLSGSLRGFDDWASLRLDQAAAGRYAVKFQGGDFLDFGSGDFLDFGSGAILVGVESGDFLDFGSGSERQELDFESAASCRTAWRSRIARGRSSTTRLRTHSPATRSR
jgi:hypothetical protein